jgi:hypothetical protein
VQFTKPRYAYKPCFEPKDLLNKVLLGENLTNNQKDEENGISIEEKRLKFMKYTLCLQLQDRIKDNKKQSEELYKQFDSSINYAFLFIPSGIHKILKFITKWC